MLKHHRLEHHFVRHLPEVLEAGLLYVSMEYATASHLCCCGCGEEVVTPFSPAQWKMTFDGETVSLNPSVGNWLQSCRSHYVIRNGKVIDAGPWSDEQIAVGLVHDRAAREAMFVGSPAAKPITPAPPPVGKKSLWATFKAWIG
jgi:hypothetical protein